MTRDTVARVRATARTLSYRLNPPFGVSSGAHSTAMPGPGASFGGYREYGYGDDLRLLDWNVFARHGRPFVKVFQHDRASAFVIILDASRSMFAPDRRKWELACEAAATLSWVAARDEDPVGYVIATDRVEAESRPARGGRSADGFADVLAEFSPHGTGTDMMQALTRASRLLPKPGVFMVISDCLDSNHVMPKWIEGLREFRQHRLVSLVLTSPLDAELADVGLAPIDDVEGGGRRWVDTSSLRVRQAFARAAAKRRREVMQGLSRAGALPVEIWTDRALVAQLGRLLRTRVSA